jgi:site-specific DNA recombinase
MDSARVRADHRFGDVRARTAAARGACALDGAASSRVIPYASDRLLKCGNCGAGMTLITGKSGRYRYYRCTSRHNKGNRSCGSGNIPMEMLDTLVLDELAERTFTPRRLELMLLEAQRLIEERRSADKETLARLRAELKRQELRLARLYDALESGVVGADETFQRRMQQAKSAREGVLVEMAGLRRRNALPAARIAPNQVAAFIKVIRAKLRDKSSTFAKDYLSALVDEVRIVGDTATITGSNAAGD